MTTICCCFADLGPVWSFNMWHTGYGRCWHHVWSQEKLFCDWRWWVAICLHYCPWAW